jgi:hypothetical protein
MVASWRESGWREQVPMPTTRWSPAGPRVPDPQHSNPAANPGIRRPDWVTDGARFEYVPEELTQDHSASGVTQLRSVLIDHTPEDHDYGVGTGAGLTVAQSQRQNSRVRSEDTGAVTARRYAAPVRQDGEYHVERTQEPVYPVGSPGSVVFQQRADPRTSPNASIRGPGWRVSRWRDRTYIRHTWEGANDHRPLYLRNAYTAPASPPVPNGNQYTSPFATAVTASVRNVVTVAPQLRRNPRQWDEAMTTDGSEEVQLSPGFLSGGL